MANRHIIDVIAGDGIGREVMPAAIRCLDKLSAVHGFELEWRERDWNSERYLRDGAMMPKNGIEQMSDGDAIFLGAVGTPEIPDDVTLWGLLIPIRRDFMQYINLRPTKLLPGLEARVRGVDSIDLMVVRENVEGEYSEVGGRVYRGRPEEIAIQEAIFTRTGVDRVARFAFDLAARRTGRLVSATKSNGIIHSMPFWDEVVAGVGAEYPQVELESVLIDALAARGVLHPSSFDVVVASNLFGDILSDLFSAVAGSIGIAPSANLNPEREFPSLFEPVHGSAPDIAGKGLANPVGQMWAGAMMLDHLGETAAAAEIISAFEGVLASGNSTRDLGGSLSTDDFTDAVFDRLGA
ncbi:tartrate dehydrogenase/decarboxylase/D-malate dehydrogenase [Leucobacter exalbidus]|uniref:D-malate dehydrogenase (decarboxylating) n=1 Tax=Leucobacter exalbidus TaxID=662960 RepID=A0A940PTN8_9MICO|nr:tartrate dehydrogenase [Leucobacter exalbidus]MBP1326697.1 tartrate dehydrogenase/decarboxylase/D-malate dehydrogenase [Leucobacter exalbidus]